MSEIKRYVYWYMEYAYCLCSCYQTYYWLDPKLREGQNERYVSSLEFSIETQPGQQEIRLKPNVS